MLAEVTVKTTELIRIYGQMRLRILQLSPQEQLDADALVKVYMSDKSDYVMQALAATKLKVMISP